MTTRKSGRSPIKPLRRQVVGKPASDTKPVALTVKVNQATYVRLCTLGATQRRTNQDLLQEAIQQYLDRVRA
jgi:hypothetical protein